MSSASTDWSTTPVWAAPAAEPDVVPQAGPSPARRRRRRRRFRRALIAGVALVLVLIAVERFGRSYAEGEIAGRLQAGGVTGDVEVSVGGPWWRPVVLPALVTGDLDQVRITITDGSLAGLRVDSVDYLLSGIHGDVSLLNGTVAVTSIDNGSVVMRIPPEVVSDGVGVEVDIRSGRLVTGDPPAPIEVKVADGSLVFSGGPLTGNGRPPPIPIADPYVLPCEPTVSIVEDALQLACDGDQLPGILQVPLQGSPPESTGDAPSSELPPPQSTERPGG